MNEKKTKILIVEDSSTSQQLLAYVLQKYTFIDLIGMVNNGKEALSAIKRNRPDVILMDIIMPVMDGIQTTKEIMHSDPIPIVIVSSYYNGKEVDESIEALQAGAIGIIEKPKGVVDPSFKNFEKELISLIKTASEIKLITRHSTKVEAIPAKFFHQKYSVVVIGASLGGPQALITILSSLPANFPLPILVVQHIAQGFITGLVDWMNRNTKLKVVLAKNNERPQPGYVYFSPNDSHLEFNADLTIRLSTDIDSSGAIPSVNRLFRSTAQVFGSKAIGVLLTGMGRDGAESLLLMKQKGALTIVQDKDSCMVFGMPKEAIQLGAAMKVLPLAEIAPTLKTLV